MSQCVIKADNDLLRGVAVPRDHVPSSQEAVQCLYGVALIFRAHPDTTLVSDDDRSLRLNDAAFVRPMALAVARRASSGAADFNAQGASMSLLALARLVSAEQSSLDPILRKCLEFLPREVALGNFRFTNMVQSAFNLLAPVLLPSVTDFARSQALSPAVPVGDVSVATAVTRADKAEISALSAGEAVPSDDDEEVDEDVAPISEELADSGVIVHEFPYADSPHAETDWAQLLVDVNDPYAVKLALQVEHQFEVLHDLQMVRRNVPAPAASAPVLRDNAAEWLSAISTFRDHDRKRSNEDLFSLTLPPGVDSSSNLAASYLYHRGRIAHVNNILARSQPGRVFNFPEFRPGQSAEALCDCSFCSKRRAGALAAAATAAAAAAAAAEPVAAAGPAVPPEPVPAPVPAPAPAAPAPPRVWPTVSPTVFATNAAWAIRTSPAFIRLLGRLYEPSGASRNYFTHGVKRDASWQVAEKSLMDEAYSGLDCRSVSKKVFAGRSPKWFRDNNRRDLFQNRYTFPMFVDSKYCVPPYWVRGGEKGGKERLCSALDGGDLFDMGFRVKVLAVSSDPLITTGWDGIEGQLQLPEQRLEEGVRIWQIPSKSTLYTVDKVYIVALLWHPSFEDVLDSGAVLGDECYKDMYGVFPDRRRGRPQRIKKVPKHGALRSEVDNCGVQGFGKDDAGPWGAINWDLKDFRTFWEEDYAPIRREMDKIDRRRGSEFKISAIVKRRQPPPKEKKKKRDT